MVQFVYANNVSTTLADALTNTATTITLASSANLPPIPAGQYFAITLNDAATRSVFEVCWATAVSGANLTVLRGQEGTAAQSWLVGDDVYATDTAGVLQSLANANGNSSNAFAVANTAPGSQNAVPTRQAFDVSRQNITSSTTFTPSAYHTVITCANSAAITVTVDPGTIPGQRVIITGSQAASVTVASSVSSGDPYFNMPDASIIYSWTMNAASGASFSMIWDGTNWRCQTAGPTVVAPATAANEAVSLGQMLNSGSVVSNNGALTTATATITFTTESTPINIICVGNAGTTLGFTNIFFSAVGGTIIHQTANWTTVSASGSSTSGTVIAQMQFPANTSCSITMTSNAVSGTLVNNLGFAYLGVPY